MASLLSSKGLWVGGKMMGWSQDRGVLARSWPVILPHRELGVLKGKL